MGTLNTVILTVIIVCVAIIICLCVVRILCKLVPASDGWPAVPCRETIDIYRLTEPITATVIDPPDGRPGNTECIICCDNRENMILFPCGHGNLCYKCFCIKPMALCPFCATPIVEVRLFQEK
jgi:hypothetical protein